MSNNDTDKKDNFREIRKRRKRRNISKLLSTGSFRKGDRSQLESELKGVLCDDCGQPKKGCICKAKI